MSMKKLVKSWSLPDRSDERQQLTLRVGYDTYARLHALKELYPNRSVNDMINDILKNGLDEIIDALPSYPISYEEACEIAHHEGGKPEDYMNGKTGPAVHFDGVYRRILIQKSESEGEAA
jgi:hypothetical protein